MIIPSLFFNKIAPERIASSGYDTGNAPTSSPSHAFGNLPSNVDVL